MRGKRGAGGRRRGEEAGGGSWLDTHAHTARGVTRIPHNIHPPNKHTTQSSSHDVLTSLIRTHRHTTQTQVCFQIRDANNERGVLRVRI